MQQAELPTAEALAIAGLSSTSWYNLVARDHYAAAPPTTTTKPRMFTVDDIVALHVVRHYLDLHTGPAMAGRIGAAVRTELAKASADQEFFSVVFAQDGTPLRVIPTLPPPSVTGHVFPLAEIRKAIREAVAAKLEAGA